ncbi:hypothetical protein WDZ92_43390, partial [Nostoc sp. NIES-2111]
MNHPPANLWRIGLARRGRIHRRPMTQPDAAPGLATGQESAGRRPLGPAPAPPPTGPPHDNILDPGPGTRTPWARIGIDT